MNPDQYNDRELRAGNIHPDDITRLAKIAQQVLSLDVDGKFGPNTRAAVLQHFAEQDSVAKPLTITNGWLDGDGVNIIKTHQSWFGGPLNGNAPKGVVCHVSATNAGTGVNMAKNRARPFVKGQDRLSSWHASVESDGSLIQMVPFTHKAWHAGSPTAKAVPGIGSANYNTVGIEIVGWEKGPFPVEQVLGYARLLKAIVQAYVIPRKYAMITHASIDPSRRSDPGKVWMDNHAERVLNLTYA